MNRWRVWHLLAVLVGITGTGDWLSSQTPATEQRYSARQRDEVVTLTDRQTDTVVTIVPSVGNIATGMRVKGHNVLRFPHTSVAEFRERPNATGIPFMGPWINRLDEPAFYANGKRHVFDMSLGNIRGEVAIHGFLTGTNLLARRVRRHHVRRGVGDEPARFRPAAVLDASVAVRAHHRDDLSPERRRARGGHDALQQERRADAGGDWLPSLLSADGFARATSGRFRSARGPAGYSIRGSCRPARPSRPSGCCRGRRPAFATTTSTRCSATSSAMPRAAPR